MIVAWSGWMQMPVKPEWEECRSQFLFTLNQIYQQNCLIWCVALCLLRPNTYCVASCFPRIKDLLCCSLFPQKHTHIALLSVCAESNAYYVLRCFPRNTHTPIALLPASLETHILLCFLFPRKQTHIVIMHTSFELLSKTNKDAQDLQDIWFMYFVLCFEYLRPLAGHRGHLSN